jgi:hypothetical protein
MLIISIGYRPYKKDKPIPVASCSDIQYLLKGCFAHPELRDAISAYLNNIELEDEVLFRTKIGRAFSPGCMSRMFSITYKAAGFESCTSHTGSRPLAKNLNAQNASIHNIQKVLRRSNINTTESHYLPVDGDTL